MPRPNKYKDIWEAAYNNLYSKYRIYNLGISVREYTRIVTPPARCRLCGCTPQEVLTQKRGKETCQLMYLFLQRDLEDNWVGLCRTCKFLLSHHDLQECLRACARIMARNRHGCINNFIAPKPGLTRS